MSRGRSASEIVERELATHLNKLEDYTSADVLAYVGPILYSVDDRIKDAVEALRRPRRTKLLFILETTGGFAEVVRRISDTLRHHYKEVDFLVPSHAMSAGTILAMSGDAIWMNYYSVLGPIDPQVPSTDGRLFPALGSLIRYEEVLAKANSGKAGPGDLQILLSFNQGELYSYQQARDLSISLLEEWLVKYKFKNWKETDRRKISVTRQMRTDRARKIANSLNDVRRWNSHGIGISMEVLRKELKLKIDDFGKDKVLDQCVREYHTLLLDYMTTHRRSSIVHTRNTLDAER